MTYLFGNSAGDFKPTCKLIGNLKMSDGITVYFEENNNNWNAPVDSLAYFIDRGQQVIFVTGNPIKCLIYRSIGFCTISILLPILLKYKDKIVQ